jgi:hypothetical protein
MSSPKVTIREEVFENPLLPATGFTTVIIGMANKGDVGVFKTTGSTDQFNKYWGTPISSSLLYFTAKKYYAYSANLIVARVTDGTDVAASVKVPARIESGFDVQPDLVSIEALSSGTWGNNIEVKFTRTSVADNKYAVEVFYNNVSVEKYLNCKLLSGDSDFIETKINGVSAYIDISINYESAGVDEVTLTNKKVALANGTNGDTNSSAIATNISALLEKLKDKDAFTFDLVIVPDMSYDVGVMSSLKDLVIERNDCQTVIDMPLSVGTSGDPVDASIKWTNGEYDNPDTVLNPDSLVLDEKNVFTYGFWQKDYDDAEKIYKWIPPSIYIAQKFAYLESTSYRWFACAGMSDGRLSTVDVQYSPSQAERDLMYGEQLDGSINVVNPIVKFISEGVVIWGQRTTERSNKPTNRINVVVMLNYVKQQLYKIGKEMQFKINDETLWTEYETKVGNVLNYVLQNRGLTSYSIVPGSVSNTPEVIANNKFVGKITLVPTSVAEDIEFIVQVTPQGVTVTE